MAVPGSGIVIDWGPMLNSDFDPAFEVDFVGSSSPTTKHRSGAAPAVIDDGSAGDDATEAKFVDFSDEKLREYINRWRFKETKGLLKAMPDGGEKMRIHLNLMEKELERREGVRQRKEDRVHRQQANVTGGSSEDTPDPYTFTSDDWLSDNMSEKYSISPSPTSNIKSCVKAKRVGFSNVQRPFSQHKHAYPNKNGQTAKRSANHHMKTIELHPKSTTKSLNMYNDSTDGTGKRPLRSCNLRQENKIVGSNCSQNKLAEDAIFGSDSDKWWDRSKKKASPYLKFKKRDVVHMDLDDDTEPARLADIEVSDKWDASKIYYPISSDSGAVELTHSDMKCLEPEEYLKSPIINFYIQYLKNSRPCQDLYMFNTYFYCKLEEALSTMETESGPSVLHLDSLGLHPSQKFFDTVQRFLEAEWCHLQKNSSYDIPFSRKIWERLPRYMIKEKVQIPRQQNEYDCGLFMLYYIDRFIQEARQRLTTEELCMFGCKWFQSKDASGLREGIRTLLFDVFQNAQEDSVSETQVGDHSEGDKDVDTKIIMLDDE